MPVAYGRAYRLLPLGESGIHAGARRADEGDSDFVLVLDPRKVSAIGHPWRLICRLEAGGPHAPHPGSLVYSGPSANFCRMGSVSCQAILDRPSRLRRRSSSIPSRKLCVAEVQRNISNVIGFAR
jgi:hypothetical protein